MVLGILTLQPGIKLSAGWRYNQRHLGFNGDPTMGWTQNGLLLGAAVQPSRIFRFNVNYESMDSKASNSNTASNTYTREAPNKTYQIKGRAVVTPAKWVNFAIAANDFNGKNDDPLVNHFEHSHDLSFAAQLIPTEALSLDFNFAHDDVFSQTDICYAFVPNANASLPPGAANTGTCTVANSGPGVGDPSFYLGHATYDAPVVFFSGALNFAPSKYFKFNGGARVTSTNGTAELLNPLMVPGALQSKVVSPFSDLQVNIAPQWSWHGNWVHHGYAESGGPGPASRNFHGDVVTLSVKYAF
jgi:hypothetical protein